MIFNCFITRDVLCQFDGTSDLISMTCPHIATLSPFTSDVCWIIRMTHSCTIWRSGYIIAPDLHIKHRRGGGGAVGGYGRRGGCCGRIMGFWLHYTLRIWFQFGCMSTVIITALNSWQDWMTKLILDYYWCNSMITFRVTWKLLIICNLAHN